MEDRREHSRTSVVKGATLFYNNGNSSVPCVVMDQSETGARIRIDVHELFKCPLTFQLKYLNVDKIHKCHCVWSDKNIVGLEYVDC